ncbi:hypothetical protein [Mycobacterium deserti]|uniref:Porin n=1 Tax=Mycobacterium deserti TaxID=2978347 RepID=A0ABT2M5D8_9MYCO|nr:hypothetical protein [Mycobacterium deserti]MCT7657462.1 hypothetical protein [Mycobacterium deserti]
MQYKTRYSATLFAAIGAAVIMAPPAAGAPECTSIAPNTTQCETNGSSQIVTSPSITTGPYWGWPYGGGFSFSLGGFGF